MTDLGPGDDELIAAVARGDQPALLVLYDRHGRMGYGLAYRILGDAGAALTRRWCANLRTMCLATARKSLR